MQHCMGRRAAAHERESFVGGVMEAPWKAGDTVSAICPHCGDLVTARYAHRSVLIPRTRLKVPHVLVSVCPTCNAMLSVPRQSMAQLREISVGK